MGCRIEVRHRKSGPNTKPVAYQFDVDSIVIGRGRGADIQLPHRSVSVRHARIRFRSDLISVEDLGSRNGTRVGKRTLKEGQSSMVEEGISFSIGVYELVVQRVAGVKVTTSRETAALARELLRQQNVGNYLDRTLRVSAGKDAGKKFFVPPAPSSSRIGRGEDVEFRIADVDASRDHAEIVCNVSGVLLRDSASKNGTKINGVLVSEDTPIHDGDEIQIGRTVLVFSDPSESLLERMAHASEKDIQRSSNDIPTKSEKAGSEEELGGSGKQDGRSHFWLEATVIGVALLLGLLSIGFYLYLLN